MALSGWIKFIMYKPAAIVMTVIMSLSLAFLTLTYAQWLSHLILSNRMAQKVVASSPNLNSPFKNNSLPQNAQRDPAEKLVEFQSVL